MLAIRLQRTGRKGHAQFRVVVQEARLSPASGRVVARLGNYDPHSKVINLDTDKAKLYLNNGAQPSERAASLLKKEGIKLPGWVMLPTRQKRAIKNPDKLRRNRPADAPTPEPKNDVVPAEASDSAVEGTEESTQTTEPTAIDGEVTETATQQTETEAPDNSNETLDAETLIDKETKEEVSSEEPAPEAETKK